MKKIVTVKRDGINIDLDISRIVAITSKGKSGTYGIIFEFAVWTVDGDSYEEVHKTWSDYVQH